MKYRLYIYIKSFFKISTFFRTNVIPLAENKSGSNHSYKKTHFQYKSKERRQDIAFICNKLIKMIIL